MKKILIVVVIFISSYSYAQTAVDSTYNNGHYRVRMEFFEQVPVKKNAIVFLGNSITEAGDWSDVMPEKYILNRGISGDITYGILARLDKILEYKPSKIFLLIGVNDLKREIPNELIVENYRKIVDQVKAKSSKTKLYLQSVLPINESLLIEAFESVKMENITYLNDALQQIANEKNVKYVDLWKALADSEEQLKKEFTLDGIHLKPVAYIDWVRYLKEQKHL
jgi:lysophospholipase L1-like esterase